MTLSDHLFLEEVRLPPSTEWFPPTTGWRFVRVTQGVAYWLGKTLTRELSQGDVLVLSPGATGTLRASQLGEARLHRLHFWPDLLTGFLTPAERDHFSSSLAKRPIEVNVLPGSHPVGQHFTEVVTLPPVFNRLIQRSKALFLVVSYFVEEFSRYRESDEPIQPAPTRFDQLLDQITDQALLDQTTLDLAKFFGCSRRHFSRLFSDHFGVSIRAKRTSLRMSKASHLLARGDAKIIDVAMECGYHNLRLFNATFKKHFGLSPSKWRMQQMSKGRSLVKNAGVPILRPPSPGVVLD